MEPYQKIRLKDENFVVDVDADGSAVHIGALQTLEKGSVRGLCGNYNGNLTDDMMSASGQLLKFLILLDPIGCRDSTSVHANVALISESVRGLGPATQQQTFSRPSFPLMVSLCLYSAC